MIALLVSFLLAYSVVSIVYAIYNFAEYDDYVRMMDNRAASRRYVYSATAVKHYVKMAEKHYRQMWFCFLWPIFIVKDWLENVSKSRKIVESTKESLTDG